MERYNEVDGNLITMALNGDFNVIAHGCNCWCRMGAGLAPQMVKAFGCNTFPLERAQYVGDINKLGQIDSKAFSLGNGEAYLADLYSEDKDLYVVNAYTQFHFGKYHEGGVDKPVDYDAITLVMRKLNHKFRNQHIGLPYVIGCGLAGGDINVVIPIIKRELKDMIITMVKFDGK